MSWSKSIHSLVEVAIIAVFGFGIAFYLGSTLSTALPTNSTAQLAVNNIIGGFNSAISNVFVPVIAILFILFLYVVVVKSGVLKRMGE